MGHRDAGWGSNGELSEMWALDAIWKHCLRLLRDEA